MEDNLQKLINKLEEARQKNAITPKHIEGFLTKVLKFVKDSKTEFETLSAENLKKINEAIKQIELQDSGKNLTKVQEVLKMVQNQHKDTISSVTRETFNARGEFETKIEELKDLMEQVKNTKPKDGYVPIKGKDYFDGEQGKEGSPDTGLQIVNKINSLDAKAEKIDASHIKNLPKAVHQTIIEGAHGGAYETPIKTSAGVPLSKDASGAFILPASGGTGDMTKAVYDPANIAEQLVGLNATQTLANKTLTAPKFANGGFIADANGNELIIFNTTGSAVNELTIANGATTVGPTISATGETNVDINFQAKGTGVYNFLGTSTNTGALHIFEDTDNGTNNIRLTVAANLLASFTLTLPSASDTLVGKITTDTFQNKTIALGSNTVSGTKAQFDTAVTDGNFLYVGDVTQYTDEMAQDAVGAMVDATLVYVDATPLLTRGAITGDVSVPQASNTATLASIISAGGPTGSATVAPIITYDAKGRLTAVSSATITPAVGSITGLGTGVATALAVNVGSAGAFITFNGNAGTPSALVGTNISGTGASFTAGNATLAATVASANEATDTTCFPLFITASGTQSLATKNNTALTFNSNTGALGATSFVGAGTSLTGIPYSLTGTANQITLSAATGNITFSLPNDLRITSASVGTNADSIPTLSSTSTLTNKTLTSPTLTTPSAFTTGGTITLAENTSIALDPAGSADGKYTGITVTGVAGYVQAFGDLVYLAVADSRWELADADAAATAGPVALAMVVVAGGSDGAACTLLLQGIIRADAKFPTMTIGATQFVGETAGAIQGAIPTGADNIIRTVGYALTADELYFNPSTDWQVTVA